MPTLPLPSTVSTYWLFVAVAIALCLGALGAFVFTDSLGAPQEADDAQLPQHRPRPKPGRVVLRDEERDGPVLPRAPKPTSESGT